MHSSLQWADGRDAQRPLSLRFESKPFWDRLECEIGVNSTGAAIILDICSTPDWVSYSRNADHYDVPARYKSPLYTWRKVVSQVDTLAKLDLIENDKSKSGTRGWQSAIRATDNLRRIVADIIGGRRLILAKPAEVILLRNKQKKLIDYQDTRQLDRMRRNVERYNEAILGTNLDPAICAPLARIFNTDFNRGGRLYAMGSSWQNIKSEARKNLTIGGEPVIELDYCTLHPAILYAEAGATMPPDCYALDGWQRNLVKVAMLTLINAPTIHKARHSIAHSDLMADRAEIGSQEAMRLASKLIEDIKRLHEPISYAFHSDAGARLMSIDAAMAETVMNIMLSQGIVVLPVHDSFLVPASQADKLEDAMLQAAHKAGFHALKVSAK